MSAPTLVNLRTIGGLLSRRLDDDPVGYLDAVVPAVLARYRTVARWAGEAADRAHDAWTRLDEHIDAGTRDTPEAVAIAAELSAHLDELDRYEALHLAHPLPGEATDPGSALGPPS